MINTTRHREIWSPVDYPDARVLIVGAGAIGSRTFEMLASTGFTNIILMDFDHVEDHNIPNQLYTRQHLGMPKVGACRLFSEELAGKDARELMQFFNHKLTDDDTPSELFGRMDNWPTIVVSAVDSFEARGIVRRFASKCMASFFVDGRMSSNQAICFCHKIDDDKGSDAWWGTVGDDDDPRYETSLCGEPLSLGTNASMAGAMQAQSVMNYLKGGYYEPFLRIMTAPWEMMRDAKLGG